MAKSNNTNDFYPCMKSVRIPRSYIEILDTMQEMDYSQVPRADAIRRCIRQQIKNVVVLEKTPTTTPEDPGVSVKFPCDPYESFVPAKVVNDCIGLALEDYAEKVKKWQR